MYSQVRASKDDKFFTWCSHSAMMTVFFLCPASEDMITLSWKAWDMTQLGILEIPRLDHWSSNRQTLSMNQFWPPRSLSCSHRCLGDIENTLFKIWEKKKNAEWVDWHDQPLFRNGANLTRCHFYTSGNSFPKYFRWLAVVVKQVWDSVVVTSIVQ